MYFSPNEVLEYTAKKKLKKPTESVSLFVVGTQYSLSSLCNICVQSVDWKFSTNEAFQEYQRENNPKLFKLFVLSWHEAHKQSIITAMCMMHPASTCWRHENSIEFRGMSLRITSHENIIFQYIYLFMCPSSAIPVKGWACKSGMFIT